MPGPQGVQATRFRLIRRGFTGLTIVAFTMAHVFSLSSAGIPYVSPLSFIITCLIAWELGFWAGVVWVVLFQIILPCILSYFDLGLLVVFAEFRHLLLVMMATSSVSQMALAYLTARLRSTTEQLQSTLAEVKELRGFLPICAWCKDIRDVSGNWEKMESYIARHSHATFTHGLCPKCLEIQMRGANL